MKNKKKANDAVVTAIIGFLTVGGAVYGYKAGKVIKARDEAYIAKHSQVCDTYKEYGSCSSATGPQLRTHITGIMAVSGGILGFLSGGMVCTDAVDYITKKYSKNKRDDFELEK